MIGEVKGYYNGVTLVERASFSIARLMISFTLAVNGTSSTGRSRKCPSASCPT